TRRGQAGRDAALRFARRLKQQGFLPTHHFAERFLQRVLARGLRFDPRTFRREFFAARHYRQTRPGFSTRIAVVRGVPVIYRRDGRTGERIVLVSVLSVGKQPPTAPVRDAHRGAWAGLEDAVGRALLAMELAAREFAEGRAALGGAERERLVAELVRLDRELGEGWGYARAIPPPLRARIDSAAALLREAPACGDGAGDTLSLVASGVLLGLSR
ncbi:MAG TPA: hypothetical protein PLO00_09335, partial [Usitatibacteraceae bacterium]|nr:hypothetical protein [Usitatibacteraceae bacterium]